MSDPLTSRWDAALGRGRTSITARRARLESKLWLIGQASAAAALAWFLARDVFDHQSPFFAPISAVVGLGTSYGQRWRRIAEITAGVAVGVLIADLLVTWLGSGALQLGLIVALSMSAALLLDAGALFVTQAAVQSIVITALVPAPGQAFTRWTDALIGGGVALVAATIVPRAPLRRPSEQAGKVLDRIASLLRGAADGIDSGDVDVTLALLNDARDSDGLVRELQGAADEGLSIVRASPFRVRHRPGLMSLAQLVQPLDLALRNTRVVVRRVAVAAYRRDPVPGSYARLLEDTAEVVDDLAGTLRRAESLEPLRERLGRLAQASALVEQTTDLSAQVILGELRSILSDLLRLTGLDPLEATDAIPPITR